MKRFLTCTTLFFSITSFGQAKSIGPIGITVRDMNTSVKFYSEVLGFKKISDEEFTGSDYEQLENVFGLHIRIVRMQLGDEQIELADYLTSGEEAFPKMPKQTIFHFNISRLL